MGKRFDYVRVAMEGTECRTFKLPRNPELLGLIGYEYGKNMERHAS